MSRIRDIAKILSGSTDMATDAEVAASYAPLSNPTFTAIGGDEGGQINLAAAATNTTLSGNVALDINQNRLRIFETGGSNRGYYLDISSGGNGVATNLVSSGSVTLIQELVLSGSSGFSFSSIPQTYKQLFLDWKGIQHSATGSAFVIRLNSDSGSNYIWTRVGNTGGTTYNGGSATTSSVNENSFGEHTTSASFHQAAQGFLHIDNYFSTSRVKSYFAFSSWLNGVNSTSTGAYYRGFYNSTSAISSIDIIRTAGTSTISNLSNTSVRLYGIL